MSIILLHLCSLPTYDEAVFVSPYFRCTGTQRYCNIFNAVIREGIAKMVNTFVN